jgi:hypothetical protein
VKPLPPDAKRNRRAPHHRLRSPDRGLQAVRRRCYTDSWSRDPGLSHIQRSRARSLAVANRRPFCILARALSG